MIAKRVRTVNAARVAKTASVVARLAQARAVIEVAGYGLHSLGHTAAFEKLQEIDRELTTIIKGVGR